MLIYHAKIFIKCINAFVCTGNFKSKGLPNSFQTQILSKLHAKMIASIPHGEKTNSAIILGFLTGVPAFKVYSGFAFDTPPYDNFGRTIMEHFVEETGF